MNVNAVVVGFGVTEMDELVDWKHIVFVFEGVCDDMCAKWNQFNSLKVAANLPRDIIDAKLQLRGHIEQQ